MRTTVTLDDDVATLLRKRREATGEGFKEALNSALRLGLAQAAKPARRKKASFKTYSTGRPLIEDLDDVSAVLERIEGPRHR